MIMRPRELTLGFLAAALLAGTALPAGAWPPNAASTDLEAYESAIQSEFLLHIDPVWLSFEPDKEAAKGKGPAPAASPQPGTAAAFSPQETQSAIARAIKSGYSVGIEPEQFPAELNRGYAVTESIKTAVRAGFDAPVGDEMRMTAAAAEAKLALGHLAPAISWAWHTGVDMSFQGRGTSAVESGPQFKLGDDRLALTLSPKVAHSLGPHHESGDVAFAYAAGLKGEIAKGVALGIEAFGATSEIAAVPGTALQTHRTSPGLYVGVGLLPPPKADANGSKLSLEIGALTGMSETHSDWAGKVKAAVSW
jgi:hypothetical protein